MRVFVTGGTGYVGRQVLSALAARGQTIRALVRKGSQGRLPVLPNIELVFGDATEPATLAGALTQVDAVIHLVGIIREYPRQRVTFERLHVEATRNVLAVAKAAGVKRYLQMSALGTRPNAHARYHQTKYRAEQLVQSSGLDWTIFRPSIIFGPEDQFVNMFAGILRTSPVFPLVGGGHQRMQPVAVEDVAVGFAKALEQPETIGKTYEVGGPTAYTFREMMAEVAAALGRPFRPVFVPIWWMGFLATFLEGTPSFPVSRDQLRMLQEENTCDPRPYLETFQIRPLPYPEGIRRYVRPIGGLDQTKGTSRCSPGR